MTPTGARTESRALPSFTRGGVFVSKFLVALLACVALAVSACGGSQGNNGPASTGNTAKAQKGGKMTLGAASGIPQLNPAAAGTAFEITLNTLLWDGLTKLDKSGEAAPDLATSWQASNGNKTWTFKLAPNLKFSNGKALTAQDVAKSFQYYLDPETTTQFKQQLASIKSAQAVGSDQVQLNLKTPNALVPKLIADVKVLDLSTLKSINKTPVVTGPFKVKSFIPDQRLTLVRNDNFHGTPTPLDELDIVRASDATAAVTSLRSGDLDALWSAPPSDVASLRSQFNIVEPKINGQYVSWEVDMTSPPFNDVRARQALAYAIDRNAIFKAAYYGQGDVSKTNTPLAENNPWFGGKLTNYSYNLDKAKRLFQAAGVKQVTWWGVSDQYPEWNTSAQILQESLKKIGVTMKIVNRDLSTWPNKFYPAGKKFPGLIVPNFQTYNSDPSLQLSFLLPGRCECNWNSKAFQTSYDKALSISDKAQRKAEWAKAQELINKDVPIYVPVQSAVVTATNKKVTGLWVDASGTPHLEQAGFTAGA
jgi:peptide/nickel transport system substrate-binding protein